MESKLISAAGEGRTNEVKDILTKNPTISVNWRNSGRTALRVACELDHDSVVSILLAHPDIDVNLQDDNENTPFTIACQKGTTRCVRQLLKDSRVILDGFQLPRFTPLWHAAVRNHLDTIKWWIASRREMDLGVRTHFIGWAKKKRQYESDQNFEARKQQYAPVVSLLERFEESPDETRSEVRKELGANGQSPTTILILIFESHLISSIVDFKVTTPPKLTRDQYLAFLDTISDEQSEFSATLPAQSSSKPSPRPTQPTPAVVTQPTPPSQSAANPAQQHTLQPRAPTGPTQIASLAARDDTSTSTISHRLCDLL